MVRKNILLSVIIIAAFLSAGCSDNASDDAAKQKPVEEVLEESLEIAVVEQVLEEVKVEDMEEVEVKENLDELEKDENLSEAETDEIITGVAMELEGEWKRYLHHHDGFLNIFEVTGDEFVFELQVYGGANTNVVEGSAQLDGNKAYYEIEDWECGLNFIFHGDVIEITETEECHLLGMNGTFFYGDYQKGPNLIEVDMVQQGFLTEVENELFKTVVGEDYSTFLGNMMLTFEEEDLDNLQTRVKSGFVRGVPDTMQAIIMINDNFVYAAVPASGTAGINFYTNDPAYGDQIPLTIRQWKDKSPNLSGDVIFK